MARKTKKPFNITVIGTGYVGLVTGACFAHLGNRVTCVDNDTRKVENLKKLVMPIYEPGLESLVKEGVKKGKLSFTTSLKTGVKSADIIFIAVGTPSKDSGHPDLSSVENVCRSIASYIDSYKIIVEKSTVPVQTGQKIKQTLDLYAKKDIKFDVASNPEFLREGNAVSDFLNPDRIVLGADSKKARDVLLSLYSSFDCPVLVTNVETAEIIKHASNSFLAMKVSFINMVSRLCEKTGADVKLVSFGMGLDKRIGTKYVDAGLGFGGPCLEKDLKAFSRIFRNYELDSSLLEDVLKINDLQQRMFLKKVEDVLWVIKGKTLAVLGASFKPNTDDTRDSPAIFIINALIREGARIKLYDPQALKKARDIFKKKVTYCSSAQDALKNAEAALILTEWEEFKNLDLKKVKRLMKHPIIFDGRNIFDPQDMILKGFKYISVGR